MLKTDHYKRAEAEQWQTKSIEWKSCGTCITRPFCSQKVIVKRFLHSLLYNITIPFKGFSAFFYISVGKRHYNQVWVSQQEIPMCPSPASFIRFIVLCSLQIFLLRKHSKARALSVHLRKFGHQLSIIPLKTWSFALTVELIINVTCWRYTIVLPTLTPNHKQFVYCT